MKKIFQEYILYYLLIIPVCIIWAIGYLIDELMTIIAYGICSITNSKKQFDEAGKEKINSKVQIYNLLSFNNKAEIKIKERED